MAIRRVTAEEAARIIAAAVAAGEPVTVITPQALARPAGARRKGGDLETP